MTSVTDNQREYQSPPFASKQDAYDLIGIYNRDIVRLEEEIPILEERLQSMPDDFQGDREGVAMALHERRIELEALKAKVTYVRSSLIERFEHELELLNKMDHRELAPGDWLKLEGLRADIEAELATLKKLVQ